MNASPASDSENPSLSSGTTSVSLIERVRRHDEAAWHRLVDLYGPLVFSWCRQWGMRADECADLMQDVFSSVARGIDTFRHETDQDTFRGWLRVISQNAVRQYLRNQARQPRAVGGAPLICSWNNSMSMPRTTPPPSRPTAKHSTNGHWS